MLSVAHRTGLFTAMDGLGPATSTEVAAAAGLQERYVRECLNALVVGGIVTHDSVDGTYHLSAAYGLLTTDRGENVAAFAQYVGIMATVEDDVVACFHDGGGVPYERYPRFHEVMEADSAGSVVDALDDHILPLLDVTDRLEDGLDWLDLGCGRGRALVALAQRFPASRFTGWELSEEAVAHARASAEAAGVDNVTFAVRDLGDFDDTAPEAAFDVVSTFDAVHDQGRPDRLLAGIRRTLRPDGTYLMQDVHASSDVSRNLDHPMGPLLYAISTMHCMTVSLAQEGGHGLGAMWGREQARTYLADAGFTDVSVTQLDHDIQNDYWLVRP